MTTRVPLTAGCVAAAAAVVGAAAGALVGATAGGVVGAAAAAAGADVGAAGAAPPPQAARIAAPGIVPSASAAPFSIWRRERRLISSAVICFFPLPGPKGLVCAAETVRARF